MRSKGSLKSFMGQGNALEFTLPKIGNSWRVKSEGETCSYLCFKRITSGCYMERKLKSIFFGISAYVSMGFGLRFSF